MSAYCHQQLHTQCDGGSCDCLCHEKDELVATLRATLQLLVSLYVGNPGTTHELEDAREAAWLKAQEVIGGGK